MLCPPDPVWAVPSPSILHLLLVYLRGLEASLRHLQGSTPQPQNCFGEPFNSLLLTRANFTASNLRSD
jgi:hypothetical protein